jgi:NADH dehydrogenase (ubiquinone) 1 alpha subcomplex subunit 5
MIQNGSMLRTLCKIVAFKGFSTAICYKPTVADDFKCPRKIQLSLGCSLSKPFFKHKRLFCTTQEKSDRNVSEGNAETMQRTESSKPKRVKKTTGLVGIEVQPHGREILIKLYEKMLEELKKLEPNVEFRIWMETLLKKRLKILYETEDVFEIEEKIGRGQIEELIIEAENQLKEFIPMMIKERPWEAPKWHSVFILWDPVK